MRNKLKAAYKFTKKTVKATISREDNSFENKSPENKDDNLETVRTLNGRIVERTRNSQVRISSQSSSSSMSQLRGRLQIGHKQLINE